MLDRIKMKDGETLFGTGLLDCQGIQIFEGDTVFIPKHSQYDTEYPDEMRIIKYDNKLCRFNIWKGDVEFGAKVI